MCLAYFSDQSRCLSIVHHTEITPHFPLHIAYHNGDTPMHNRTGKSHRCIIGWMLGAEHSPRRSTRHGWVQTGCRTPTPHDVFVTPTGPHGLFAHPKMSFFFSQRRARISALPDYLLHALPGQSLREIFFCFVKDRPKGPPTANRQLPPTANRHQPPTANRSQPPTATNRQPSTAANCQLPPTAANHQPPTANRQSPPAANRQSPPTMVEHMSYTRSFLKKPCSGTVFFLPVKDRPARHRCCGIVRSLPG